MALYINGKEYITQAILLPDDESISPGAAKILYETADANANALIFVAPEGGATDVPAFIFGDASILNADLGWFNGLTEPSLVVVNDAKDAYVRIDAGDDAVAGSKGVYFKAAADEDIELLNLSVTGTPQFFWDESEDAFVFTKNLYTGGNIRFNSQLLLKYLGTNDLGLRNTADSGYADFSCGALNQYSTIAFQAADLNFNVYNADAATLIGNVRDSTVGMVQIWRMIGAADPYFEVGRDDTGVGSGTITNGTGTVTGSPKVLIAGANTPTITVAGTFTVNLPVGSTGTAATGGWTVTGSPVALIAGDNVITVEAGGSGTITITLSGSATVVDMFKLRAGSGTVVPLDGEGLGISFQLDNDNATPQMEERASIDVVLTDVSDGTEDAEMNIRLIVAGTVAEVASFVGGGFDLPTGKVLSVAGTQVVGARVVDARADDVANSGDVTTDGLIDALRDAMIAHGLIAAA